MKIFSNPKKIQQALENERCSGRKIGFVPTLGALHDGHAALMEKARKENDILVVSTFVNPIQFRAKAFNNYPRDPKGDRELCKKMGVDYLFAPSAEDIYPNGFDSVVEVKELVSRLEGAKIRWHYRGVTTVVAKLFNIVNPHRAYFGEKDPHQLAILRRMTEDFNFAVKIVAVKTKRGRDGLALSSRNLLLTPEMREAALIIPRSIDEIIDSIRGGEKNRSKLTKTLTRLIEKEPLAKVDYAAVVDSKTLTEEGAGNETLIYVAAFIGDLRLTDNKRC